MTYPLPNFIFIGPGKTGSTWLHETLLRHPQIYLTPAKELHFFDRYYDRGLDWYASHFAHADAVHKVVGEICTSYVFSHEAPRRIHDTLPDVRLMMTVREPAERTYSSYRYMVKHGSASGSFRNVLETNPRILNPSRYATLLGNYLAHFDRARVHCAIFDDLRSDPQGYIDTLLQWLAVDPMALGPRDRDARLPASRARSTIVARSVRRLAHAAREHRAAGAVGLVKRSTLVNRVLYRPLAESDPPLPAADAEYVRALLDPEVARLEAMLGVNLRERWGWG